MRVQHVRHRPDHDDTFELLDDTDQPILVVSGFLCHLHARGYSPNTLSAYAFDLLHFFSFLTQQQLTYQEFTASHALLLLEYLKTLPSRKSAQRFGLVLSTTTTEGTSTTSLSPATINRTFAAVSSFYDYLILSGEFTSRENPLQQVDDPALARVPERHRPFMGRASRLLVRSHHGSRPLDPQTPAPRIGAALPWVRLLCLPHPRHARARAGHDGVDRFHGALP